MTHWLLDTNIVSELKRARPSDRVVAFMADADLDGMYVSTITLMEIRFGIVSATDAVRAAEVNTWLTDQVRPMFEGRVLELTEDVMLRWRILVEEGRRAGRTFSQPDLLLAATAIEYDLTLVTRNVKDFFGLGVTIFNPWDEGR